MTTCKPESGKVIPIINLADCEAKRDCVEVCPYDVFEIREMTDKERKSISSFKGKIKLLVHGNKKAFATNSANCHSCGLCVTACPEKAIQLKSSNTMTKDNFLNTAWLFF